MENDKWCELRIKCERIVSRSARQGYAGAAALLTLRTLRETEIKLLFQPYLPQTLIQVFPCRSIRIGLGVSGVDTAFETGQAHLAFRM